MRSLPEDPDLDAAEDLLDAALNPWTCFPAAPRGARARRKRNAWKTVSNLVFYAALTAIALGAVLPGSGGGGTGVPGFPLRWAADHRMAALILLNLVILASIALRVLLGERATGDRRERVQQPQKGCGHIKAKDPKNKGTQKQRNTKAKDRKGKGTPGTGRSTASLPGERHPPASSPGKAGGGNAAADPGSL